MNTLVLQLGLVAFLVLVNAALAGTELALVSLREGQVARLAERGASGAALARLARDPNRFLATIQIGITLAGFLASASAAVTLAEPLEDRLGLLGRAAGPVSVLAVTLGLAYVTLVLGELAPKRLAMQRAERWSLAAARPLALMSTVTRPAVWLLSRSTDLAVRLLGGDPSVGREEITGDELRELLTSAPVFARHHREIIAGAVGIAERTLREIVVPRGEVVVLQADDTAADSLAALAASGYSRAPVSTTGSLDDVIGMVHLRQLLDGGQRPTRDLVVELPVFPESLEVLEAMRRMQAERMSMALVADEYGGAEGIVTTMDLIEEIVGELYDEIDRDVLSVEHLPDGSLVVAGRYPVHDLVDIGVELPPGDYATVAGFVLDRLGRLPSGAGDTVEEAGWAVTVTEVHGRRVTKVRIHRRPMADEAGHDPIR